MAFDRASKRETDDGLVSYHGCSTIDLTIAHNALAFVVTS